jgi:hypothetical protein
MGLFMRVRAGLKVFCVVTSLFPAMGSLYAAEPPSSDANLRELIAVTHLQDQLQEITQQVDSMMQSAIEDALQGAELSKEQHNILDEMRASMLALFGEVLTWKDFEAVALDVYRRSFSQREVDGMLTFYKTEAGKAVIEKMPLVTTNTMQAMQGRLAAMMPKLEKIQQETLAKLRATQH